jgi:hypothetical protein
MSWVRRHDEYEKSGGRSEDCRHSGPSSRSSKSDG